MGNACVKNKRSFRGAIKRERKRRKWKSWRVSFVRIGGKYIWQPVSQLTAVAAAATAAAAAPAAVLNDCS